jgi:hypothetical protein
MRYRHLLMYVHKHCAAYDIHTLYRFKMYVKEDVE